MNSSLTSPYWYRVAQLKPKLRGHSRIYRHFFRGEQWYILQDEMAGMYYRFTPIAYQVIGLMNGKLSVQELWDLSLDRFGDEAPTQEEMIQLLGQLHVAGAIVSDMAPDTIEIRDRGQRMVHAKKMASFRSPLFLKIPLVDPNKFLDMTSRPLKYVFGPFGAAIWLVTIISAIFLVGMHWGELTENPTDRILSAGNLAVLWLVYPFVKLMHELGHGYAVKRWGGEVHEMGIMLLVFMPIPYVDASASYSFRSKWHRVLVSSAGILTEMFVAAVACFLWLLAEPGLVRSIIFNIILIGSISTVLFNGNPLLRYDGYFILADLLDIPNLSQRGMNYLTYLMKRYIFRIQNTETPLHLPGEKHWLIGYAICSFFYRILVYFAIALFVAGKFFFIGILLAIWSSINMFLMPIFKGLKFLFFSPILRESRGRSIFTTLVIIMAISGITFIPMPSKTVAEGVTWIPEESFIRAGANGFLTDIAIKTDELVEKGQPLFKLENNDLIAKHQTLESQARVLQVAYTKALFQDQVVAQMIKADLESINASLERVASEIAELTLSSPSAGKLVLPNLEDLPGRFVKKGELIGYVITDKDPTIRVVVGQYEVDMIRNKTKGVKVRLNEDIHAVLEGRIKREVPEAMAKIPSPTLTNLGGGSIAIDPFSPESITGFENMFQFDVGLLESKPNLYFGSRAFVCFDHGYTPLAVKIYRNLRHIFLRRFNV